MLENNIITNDYVIYDKSKIELISIDFPSEFKRRLYAIISNTSLDGKKKSKKGETDDNFNYKIQQALYKFLVWLFNRFSDYNLKSKFFYEAMKNRNCGDNIRYKSQMANISDINFLKEIINIDDFIKIVREIHSHFIAYFFILKCFYIS